MKKLKYEIIKEDIINAIKEKKLNPGDKISSESELKKKYGVSATTVRKAFSDLILEGYLVGIQGVGTFVAKKQMIRALTSLSFSDELVEQGYKIDLKLHSLDEINNSSIARKLEIPLNQSIIRIKRTRLANNKPVAFHTSYISSEKLTLEQAKEISITKSFYELLKKYNIYPDRATENYSIKEIKDNTIIKALDLYKNSPCFFVKRTAYNDKNDIIEYSETYFNKDWYSVTVNING